MVSVLRRSFPDLFPLFILDTNTHNTHAQTPTLEHYTEYKLDDLVPCMMDMYSVLKAVPDNSLQAVREKFSHKKLHKASKVEVPESPPFDTTV